MVDIAQLVRVPGCGPGGRRFEPDYPPQTQAAAELAAVFKLNIGVSSSGKTQHIDCCISRFESCNPSQNKRTYLIDKSFYFT